MDEKAQIRDAMAVIDAFICRALSISSERGDRSPTPNEDMLLSALLAWYREGGDLSEVPGQLVRRRRHPTGPVVPLQAKAEDAVVYRRFSPPPLRRSAGGAGVPSVGLIESEAPNGADSEAAAIASTAAADRDGSASMTGHETADEDENRTGDGGADGAIGNDSPKETPPDEAPVARRIAPEDLVGARDASGSEGVAPPGPHAAGPPPSESPSIPTQPSPRQLMFEKPQVDAPIERRRLVLPNARAGSAFDVAIELDEEIEVDDVERSAFPVALDAARRRLQGMPDTAGDYQILLKGKRRGRPIEIAADLVVIPDPKSLWTSIPSDPSARFHKPDEAVLRQEEGDLFAIAASKRGRSHARLGTCRDDDMALGFDARTRWHIAAVADGAGSADYSREGSRVACTVALHELPALLEKNLDPVLVAHREALLQGETGHEPAVKNGLYSSLIGAAFKAAKAIERTARDANESKAKFSTTLLICVVKRIETHWFIASFSIGDGGAVVLDIDGSGVYPLTTADSGEYAGQTRFLAASEFADASRAIERLSYVVVPSFEAILLMTDGVTDPKLPTESDFKSLEAWRHFYREDLAAEVRIARDNDRAQHDLLTWLDFFSQGNHDDRTIAVLTPKDA